MKKAILSLVFLAVMFLGQALAFAEEKPIKLVFNNHTLYSDVSPVMVLDRTLVPVRLVSEALGADVNWESSVKKVTIKKNDTLLELQIEKKEVFKNGIRIEDLDVSAKIIDNRTMVPIRFVSEALGAVVKWDGASRTVFIAFNEFKEEKTAEEIFNSAINNLSGFSKYEYENYSELETILTKNESSPEKLTVKVEAKGEFEKINNVNTYYLVENAIVPATANTPKTVVTAELLAEGGMVYRNTDDGWLGLSKDDDFYNEFNKQDPGLILDSIKKFGSYYSYGNEETRFGKDCYTVITKFDPVKYKEDYKTTNQVEEEELRNNIDKLELDITAKVYIDKGSKNVVKIFLESIVSVIADDESLKIQTTNESNIINLIP